MLTFVYISNTHPGFLEEEPSYSRTSLIESWALESSVTRVTGDKSDDKRWRHATAMASNEIRRRSESGRRRYRRQRVRQATKA